MTVVFDDSFSMANENRYSNANYAIQAFIALLNEQDELHLVYMSDVARQLAAQPGNFDPLAIAKDMFESPEGKQILKDLGITGDYEGIGHCIFGYADCEEPKAAPRKENYVIFAE